MNNDPRPMTCDRLRDLLVEHVDGLLGAAEAEGARAHLAACAPCRTLQEEVRRNFAAMDAWEDEELPAGAWERLQARLPAGPVPRVASPSAALTAVAPAPRRSWLPVAVPYIAGLATAAAAALLLVLGTGDPPPLGGPPSAGPGGNASVVAPAPVVADNDPAPALRPGESRLRFEDFDNGVIRTVAFPGGIDPSKVMLVEYPAAAPAGTAPVVTGVPAVDGGPGAGEKDASGDGAGDMVR